MSDSYRYSITLCFIAYHLCRSRGAIGRVPHRTQALSFSCCYGCIQLSRSPPKSDRQHLGLCKKHFFTTCQHARARDRLRALEVYYKSQTQMLLGGDREHLYFG
ncbi:hypothetical protein QUB13_00135 [Microcoleus sp. B4-D4]